MKNDNISKNEAAPVSAGTNVPKGKPQGEHPSIKEGDSTQQRPKFGSDAAKNTSARDEQLPSLNDGQVKGSDADQDQGGEPSV